MFSSSQQPAFSFLRCRKFLLQFNCALPINFECVRLKLNDFELSTEFSTNIKAFDQAQLRTFCHVERLPSRGLTNCNSSAEQLKQLLLLNVPEFTRCVGLMSPVACAVQRPHATVRRTGVHRALSHTTAYRGFSTSNYIYTVRCREEKSMQSGSWQSRRLMRIRSAEFSKQ